MIDMSDEARQQVQTWVDQCLAYWGSFDSETLITEEMIDRQPMPPDDFIMDASAVLTDALSKVVEMHRTGSTEPTPESRLAVADLLDTAVDNALDGMTIDARKAVTRKLWDRLLDGEDA